MSTHVSEAYNVLHQAVSPNDPIVTAITNPDLDPDDLSICPVDGQSHKPDGKSLTIEHADGGSYFDVSCVKCGRSGCVGQAKTLADGIHW